MDTDTTYTLLLAVGWTTVTAAYLLVSVVNCYRSYKLSRTLPLVSSRLQTAPAVILVRNQRVHTSAMSADAI